MFDLLFRLRWVLMILCIASVTIGGLMDVQGAIGWILLGVGCVGMIGLFFILLEINSWRSR
jgi:hypothetical protein